MIRAMDIHAAKLAIDSDHALSPRQKYEQKLALTFSISDPVERAIALAHDSLAFHQAIARSLTLKGDW